MGDNTCVFVLSTHVHTYQSRCIRAGPNRLPVELPVEVEETKLVIKLAVKGHGIENLMDSGRKSHFLYQIGHFVVVDILVHYPVADHHPHLGSMHFNYNL